jgi:hypothetical protein
MLYMYSPPKACLPAKVGQTACMESIQYTLIKKGHHKMPFQLINNYLTSGALQGALPYRT